MLFATLAPPPVLRAAAADRRRPPRLLYPVHFVAPYLLGLGLLLYALPVPNPHGITRAEVRLAAAAVAAALAGLLWWAPGPLPPRYARGAAAAPYPGQPHAGPPCWVAVARAWGPPDDSDDDDD